jgi:uncharacterized 2Fe-2S/4Fe-4S cluster protein (DUF4445 family)
MPVELRLTSDEVIKLNKDETLYSALKRANIYLVASCGGKGICGKCKVKIIEGKYEAKSYVKLTARERASNIVLACQTIPENNILIDIPKESLLVVGDKISISKTRDLAEYLKSYGVSINPPTKKIYLELPQPTISDNIGDLERLKRALTQKGFGDMRFSHGFISTMAKVFRERNWKVELTYVEGDVIRDEAIYLKSKDECSTRFGVAVDIGTTTVVVYLVNLSNGEVIDIGSSYNSQIKYGDDVITRIVYATEIAVAQEGLRELRHAVVEDINTIIDSLMHKHAMGECEIEAVTVAGNTTMSHIFWGLGPSSIREAPYIPTLNYFPLWKGGAAHLSVNDQAPVYTMPCVASYVGGDIVAGVLASKMHRNKEIALFMDIGTNGEIVIGNNEWLMTAACSAGPCFEGSGIRCGMRATSGAIECVKIDAATLEPVISTIGESNPIGICGSGMIDVVSEMFLTGIIDQKGKFISGKTHRIREGEDGPEYLLYRNEKLDMDIVLTAVDIENILRAKAAIYAGVTTLLNEAGLTLDAIERIYIAGGFGNFINVEKVIILGMLPDIPKEKYVFMGNTSITGAYLCLLSRNLRKEAEEIASKMTYIELSVSRRFMDEYLSALFIPHTDINLFPSVALIRNT